MYIKIIFAIIIFVIAGYFIYQPFLTQNGNVIIQTKTPVHKIESELKPYIPALSESEPPVLGKEIKWQPGHYMMLGYNMKDRNEWKVIFNNDYFKGGQRVYLWSDLEPIKENYDFSSIESDLNFLKSNGKFLVIEPWDTFFWDKGVAVPDYILSDPEYNGGVVYRDNKAGSLSKRYDTDVMDRYIALTKALGNRFDGEEYVSAFIITETAMNLGEGSEDFNKENYHTQMTRLVKETAKAFPTTPIIIYGNWYPSGMKLLRELADKGYECGIGWGGPDIIPASNIWGYNIIREYKGKSVVGLAAQWDSYDGRWTTEELLDFGAGDMEAHFIFWIGAERKNEGGLSFRQDIIPTINKFKGRINTAIPENLKSGKISTCE
jgi:hypothetical protein